MLLTIHNLPPDIDYASIKRVIQELCLINVLLINLQTIHNGSCKVTVSTADANEAAIIIKKLNDLEIEGYKLKLELGHDSVKERAPSPSYEEKRRLNVAYKEYIKQIEPLNAPSPPRISSPSISSRPDNSSPEYPHRRKSRSKSPLRHQKSRSRSNHRRPRSKSRSRGYNRKFRRSRSRNKSPCLEQRLKSRRHRRSRSRHERSQSPGSRRKRQRTKSKSPRASKLEISSKSWHKNRRKHSSKSISRSPPRIQRDSYRNCNRRSSSKKSEDDESPNRKVIIHITASNDTEIDNVVSALNEEIEWKSNLESSDKNNCPIDESIIYADLNDTGIETKETYTAKTNDDMIRDDFERNTELILSAFANKPSTSNEVAMVLPKRAANDNTQTDPRHKIHELNRQEKRNMYDHENSSNSFNTTEMTAINRSHLNTNVIITSNVLYQSKMIESNRETTKYMPNQTHPNNFRNIPYDQNMARHNKHISAEFHQNNYYPPFIGDSQVFDERCRNTNLPNQIVPSMSVQENVNLRNEWPPPVNHHNQYPDMNYSYPHNSSHNVDPYNNYNGPPQKLIRFGNGLPSSGPATLRKAGPPTLRNPGLPNLRKPGPPTLRNSNQLNQVRNSVNNLYQNQFTNNYANSESSQSKGPFKEQFRGSLNDQCRVPFDEQFRGPINDQYRGLFDDQFRGPLNDQSRGSFDEQFRGPLNDQFRGSFDVQFRGPLSDQSRGSFDEQFRGPLNDQSRGSFDEQFRGPLNDQSRGSFDEQFRGLFNDQSRGPLNEQFRGPFNDPSRGLFNEAQLKDKKFNNDHPKANISKKVNKNKSKISQNLGSRQNQLNQSNQDVKTETDAPISQLINEVKPTSPIEQTNPIICLPDSSNDIKTSDQNILITTATEDLNNEVATERKPERKKPTRKERRPKEIIKYNAWKETQTDYFVNKKNITTESEEQYFGLVMKAARTLATTIFQATPKEKPSVNEYWFLIDYVAHKLDKMIKEKGSGLEQTEEVYINFFLEEYKEESHREFMVKYYEWCSEVFYLVEDDWDLKPENPTLTRKPRRKRSKNSHKNINRKKKGIRYRSCNGTKIGRIRLEGYKKRIIKDKKIPAQAEETPTNETNAPGNFETPNQQNEQGPESLENESLNPALKTVLEELSCQGTEVQNDISERLENSCQIEFDNDIKTVEISFELKEENVKKDEITLQNTQKLQHFKYKGTDLHLDNELISKASESVALHKDIDPKISSDQQTLKHPIDYIITNKDVSLNLIEAIDTEMTSTSETCNSIKDSPTVDNSIAERVCSTSENISISTAVNDKYLNNIALDTNIKETDNKTTLIHKADDIIPRNGGGQSRGTSETPTVYSKLTSKINPKRKMPVQPERRSKEICKYNAWKANQSDYGVTVNISTEIDEQCFKNLIIASKKLAGTVIQSTPKNLPTHNEYNILKEYIADKLQKLIREKGTVLDSSIEGYMNFFLEEYKEASHREFMEIYYKWCSEVFYLNEDDWDLICDVKANTDETDKAKKEIKKEIAGSSQNEDKIEKKKNKKKKRSGRPRNRGFKIGGVRLARYTRKVPSITTLTEDSHQSEGKAIENSETPNQQRHKMFENIAPFNLAIKTKIEGLDNPNDEITSDKDVMDTESISNSISMELTAFSADNSISETAICTSDNIPLNTASISNDKTLIDVATSDQPEMSDKATGSDLFKHLNFIEKAGPINLLENNTKTNVSEEKGTLDKEFSTNALNTGQSNKISDTNKITDVNKITTSISDRIVYSEESITLDQPDIEIKTETPDVNEDVELQNSLEQPDWPIKIETEDYVETYYQLQASDRIEMPKPISE